MKKDRLDLASCSQSNAGRMAGDDPLAALEVIHRLEVGPVRVEPRRVVCPYRIFHEGGEDEMNLIFTYEVDVFDPSDASSSNLANMIAAQVAINYGLFCRRIVFHGNFDSADRRLIQTACENTAREIFVKKFLEPNVFLTGEAKNLPPARQKSYLRAILEFPDASSFTPEADWQFWSTSRHRFSILSSGGKDSLLSFGLIDEIGHEVHPLFVNESGRHWFTARNAYRHFLGNIPNTSRVWVNSDRVFPWMLRHMPFIRKNFSDIRSDEYPIRLWTVAVFLFSVLPLIRKRGIGCVVIGNEFDTTHRTTYKGIIHYDGLYDQSRYFDNAMTRYFLRKGWSVTLFSVLRPLSEMMIQEMVVKRYPELQKLQMSCHATHKDPERIRPCGRCEKCRRIVGMLLAVGGDPTRCGYSGQQIETCLKELLRKGVHQEGAGKKQLVFMLATKGLVEVPASQKKLMREHPEILKLRFDPERSPMNGIPAELRAPLYNIFLQHARGAVKREGKAWHDFDPLTGADMEQPYPFELGLAGRSNRSGNRGISSETQGYDWGELTWT